MGSSAKRELEGITGSNEISWLNNSRSSAQEQDHVAALETFYTAQHLQGAQAQCAIFVLDEALFSQNRPTHDHLPRVA